MDHNCLIGSLAYYLTIHFRELSLIYFGLLCVVAVWQ